MNEDGRVAFVNAAVARALIRMESMKALNTYREMRGETIAYGEKEFMDIIYEEGISHNPVISMLNGEPW